MKENLELSSVRATIFVPKIGYNSDNVKKMMELFPGYLPSVVDILPKQLQALGLKINFDNPESQPWQLSTSDQLSKISFYDNKIDIIKSFSLIEKYNVDDLKDISLSMASQLSLIVEAYGFPATRLALAPKIVLPLSDGKVSVSDFSKKIFNINTLENVPVDNCDFNQVYRLSRKIKDRDVLVNHLCKFSAEMVQKTNEQELSIFPLLKVDMDINTFARPDYSFDKASIDSFFAQSYDWCNSLLNIYFD